NVIGFLNASLVDLGELAAADSSLRGFVRDREAAAQSGQIPSYLAMLYGQSKLRLGAIDSADVWLSRAIRDTVGWSERWGVPLFNTPTELRVEQGRVGEARVAAARLTTIRRGQRIIAAMLRARVRRAEGDQLGALAGLEEELRAVINDGQPSLTM